MTDAIQLFDADLERALVAAVLANPACLSRLDFLSAADLADFHAHAAFSAIRNVVEAGQPLTIHVVRTRLAADLLRHDPSRPINEHPQLGDLVWFDRLVSIETPPDPPVVGWANQVLDWTIRRKALLDAAKPDDVPHPVTSIPDNQPPDYYRLTELGNAQRLADVNVGRLRYVHDWKSWLVFDGKRWRRDSSGAENEAAKQIVEQLFFLAETAGAESQRLQTLHGDLIRAASGSDKVARASARSSEDYSLTKRAQSTAGSVMHWAMASSTSKVITNMIKLARSEPRLVAEAEDFDADRWLLNVVNGTLDLRTGELRPHRQGDMITKIAGASYNPAARAPRWERFLEQIQPNVEMRSWLQRFMGYCLTGMIREQVMMFALGIGNNGKNVLFDTMLAMLGSYAMTAAPDLLVLKHNDDHPTAFADLHGHRLVVVSEIDRGRKWAEATIKRLTGDEWITARRMRQDFYRFLATHKFVVLANTKPEVSGTDNGIWRRIQLAPFGVTILKDERDAGLLDTLKGELDGVLAWAVQGCLAWQRDGLQSPDLVADEVERYRSEQDVVGEWMGDRCLCVCNGFVRTPREDGLCSACGAWIGAVMDEDERKAAREAWVGLYPDFASWMAARGERPWTLRTFRTELTKRGWLEPYRTNAERGLSGIRLRYLPRAGVSTRVYDGRSYQ